MKLLMQCLAIGAGGFLGAVARFLVAIASRRAFPTSFPVGTFLINITGSLFLGWFLTATTGRFTVSDTTKLAIATGFVGAYTTFSTYMYESNWLIETGAFLRGMGYLISSVVVGMCAVRFGVWLGQS